MLKNWFKLCWFVKNITKHIFDIKPQPCQKSALISVRLQPHCCVFFIYLSFIFVVFVLQQLCSNSCISRIETRLNTEEKIIFFLWSVALTFAFLYILASGLSLDLCHHLVETVTNYHQLCSVFIYFLKFLVLSFQIANLS